MENIFSLSLDRNPLKLLKLKKKIKNIERIDAL